MVQWVLHVQPDTDQPLSRDRAHAPQRFPSSSWSETVVWSIQEYEILAQMKTHDLMRNDGALEICSGHLQT